MKFLFPAAVSLVMPLSAVAAPPAAFGGLLEEGVPTRAEVGMVMPPPEYDRYAAKIAEAARKDPKWFTEFSDKSKPGVPLPYDPKLGLTREEHAEYVKLWEKREFKRMDDAMLLLRKSANKTWNLVATSTTGRAGAISTLRYMEETDTFTSPNGELKRIEDIKADPDSSLGAWTGREWRYTAEDSFGKTKENFAIGKLDPSGFGVIVYRFMEVSTDGQPVVERTILIRFAPGKAGQGKSPEAKPPGDSKPAKRKTPAKR